MTASILSGDVSLRVTLTKRGSNLENHLRWMEYLSSPEFVRDWKKRFESQANLGKLQTAAREIFQERVYDRYEPNTYQRTNAALESFQAAADSQASTPGISVYSDPAIATALYGNAAGGFSYAAFFEKPIEFDSFIKSFPGDDLNVVRYRPFFDVMAAEHNRVSTEINNQTFLQQVKAKMPRSSAAATATGAA